MNIESVKIVADSSADLLELEGVAFAGAPLKIITELKEYVDSAALDVGGMVNDLAHYSGCSSTACPSPGDWMAAFGEAEHIFCVTITSGLSGTYNTAVIAAGEYEKEHPGRRVFVLDSLSVGPEMQLMVEKLRACILSGMSFEETCAAALAYREQTALLFVLESMRNLANNGRVSCLAAKAAGILGIRVVGKASDAGQLELLDKSRGEKKALRAVVEHMRELGYTGGRVIISHVGNPGAAVELQTLIRAAFGEKSEIRHCRGLTSFYAEKGGLIIGFERA